MFFSKLANETWLIKYGISAYMRKEKICDTETSSHEEIAVIKKQYSDDITLYTEPIEKEDDHEILVG